MSCLPLEGWYVRYVVNIYIYAVMLGITINHTKVRRKWFKPEVIFPGWITLLTSSVYQLVGWTSPSFPSFSAGLLAAATCLFHLEGLGKAGRSPSEAHKVLSDPSFNPPHTPKLSRYRSGPSLPMLIKSGRVILGLKKLKGKGKNSNM